MNFSDMFKNSFLEEKYIDETGVVYNIKINASTMFKLKFISYVRQGVKIEKISIPMSASNIVDANLRNVAVSNNDKYIIYTSIPEFLSEQCPYSSASELILSFKKWITRFMCYNKKENEYNLLKENNMLAVEVKNKIRKDEYWTEEKGNMVAKSYYLAWELSDNLDQNKLNELYDKLHEYTKDINNINDLDKMSEEDVENLMNNYNKMLEENPELFEELFDLFGGL